MGGSERRTPRILHASANNSTKVESMVPKPYQRNHKSDLCVSLLRSGDLEEPIGGGAQYPTFFKQQKEEAFYVNLGKTNA